MKDKNEDRAYLQNRLEREIRLAEQAENPSVSAVHKRLAKLYEDRLRRTEANGDRPTEGVEIKAALAELRYSEFPAEYARARSETAQQLGESKRSSEWRSAAERLAGKDPEND